MDSQQQQPQQIFQDNHFQVLGSRSDKESLYIAKIFLRRFGNVELHSNGEATNISVRIAERFQREGIATITKIDQFTMKANEKQIVKFIVSLKLTSEGKCRIDEELN
ncbi:unnamed protein product (macronuclear) [Paramecium tetraurelia]|uniref:DNA/RNA-binding protein Alba-like domain-containing protein n=1 Tax=Paramecium tetraurelia TaxID=5888 RepID=A0DMY8_PARTE|nr:uncharacterized protein GSPATT00018610001 [Paramecium tetraurelia]CAK84405.1 unnamed protein product [Paramecium tetraurelia]|eukprot:XP_001451802.1 hypothetical protein (macronuclear) [Paramecium tetraurelia strain d4-2]